MALTDSQWIGGMGNMSAPGPKLNIQNFESFREEGRAIIDSGVRKLTIDMQATSFIDSAGLGAIVALKKAVGAEGGIILTNLHPFVLRILDVTRTGDLFELR